MRDSAFSGGDEEPRVRRSSDGRRTLGTRRNVNSRVWFGRVNHDHGAGGVVDALLANRAQKEAGEIAVTARAND
jgi:hypothetical protein